MSNVELH